jgi:peptidyl-prolyl cis-trans isomerase C
VTRAVLLGGASLAAVLWIQPGRAGDAGVPRDQVIAVIGAPASSRSGDSGDADRGGDLTAGELEDRLAAMPPYQRAAFGATPEAVRHAVLDKVLVRDALLALDADAEKLGARPDLAYAVDRALAKATVRAVADAVPPASDVPMADVRAYYDANRARYDAPPRYALWRILCATKDEAAQVLAAALADPTPKNFAQLARDHSQDKATAMRSGDLGFLTAEGESLEPGLKVDPAIVQAAIAVHDGELVRAPVAEGTFFSVVWRRGTRAPPKRTVDDAAPAIRDALRKQRIKEATDALLATLRSTKVKDLHEDLVERLDLPEDAPVERDASR